MCFCFKLCFNHAKHDRHFFPVSVLRESLWAIPKHALSTGHFLHTSSLNVRWSSYQSYDVCFNPPRSPWIGWVFAVPWSAVWVNGELNVLMVFCLIFWYCMNKRSYVYIYITINYFYTLIYSYLYCNISQPSKPNLLYTCWSCCFIASESQQSLRPPRQCFGERWCGGFGRDPAQLRGDRSTTAKWPGWNWGRPWKFFWGWLSDIIFIFFEQFENVTIWKLAVFLWVSKRGRNNTILLGILSSRDVWWLDIVVIFIGLGYSCSQGCVVGLSGSSQWSNSPHAKGWNIKSNRNNT